MFAGTNSNKKKELSDKAQIKFFHGRTYTHEHKDTSTETHAHRHTCTHKHAKRHMHTDTHA